MSIILRIFSGAHTHTQTHVCEIFAPCGIFGEWRPQIAGGKTRFLCQLRTMRSTGSLTNLTLPLDEAVEQEVKANEC